MIIADVSVDDVFLPSYHLVVWSSEVGRWQLSSISTEGEMGRLERDVEYLLVTFA